MKELRENIKKIVFLILLLGFTSSHAQKKFFQSPKEISEFSKKATNLFKEGKFPVFFKELKPYWPLPDNEMTSLEDKTVQFMELLQSRFGKVEGVSKIKEEKISDFAIRETYILRFENQAIRLIYVFYKNKNGWILNTFKWDDELSQEFK
ncbi:hypothetical protein NAT51_11560 [Flavobacterium amniphilum]|uniref:hypothetical protein n=1 Tax=Flavobacterium amniphilum TaxID=1834035 RepID=UPI002029FF30|nr:hypothetical protein [Flavobacterium amniphilum]MCL9806164.1 hypothetical protein [Flavobacterium amniphilum]